MKENFLTTKQVSNNLQVTEKTLKNWRDKGLIQAYKVGRSVRYKESEVNNTFSQIGKSEIKING